MKLKLNKIYRTRAGNKVRVVCIDRKTINDASVIGLIIFDDNTESTALYYYSDGSYLSSKISGNDLVEEYSPWNDVEIDTKILVRTNINSEWIPRYFAGYEYGVIKAFAYGGTSWSREDKRGWKYAKLAEKDN